MANWLLSNCLLAFALALFVIGIVRLLRPSPATAHALWCIVLLKLISPLGLWWELPILMPRSEPICESQPLPLPSVPPVGMVWNEVPPESRVPFAPVESFATEWETTLASSVPMPIVEPLPIPPCDPVPALTLYSNESTPLEFMGLILLVGAGVYLLRQVVSTWRFCRLARLAATAPDALFAQVRTVSAGLGVRMPKVGVIRGLPSPVMWTLRKPLLLWPEGLEGTLNRDGREAVLIHELAHLRRRDHWVRWLEVVCGLLHWWNPLFWLARRQIRLHSELACDAWVMATKPEHRRTYAEALLQVCSRSMRVSHAAPVLGIGGDGTRDFQRRLTMIMQNDAPCQLSRWGRAGVFLLVLAFLPGFTLAQQTPKADEKEIEIVVTDGSGSLSEFELVFQSAPKETPAVEPEKEKKVKELEAKLAELTKQLAELKGQKTTDKKQEYRYEIVVKDQPDILMPKMIQSATVQGPHIKVFNKDGKELKDMKIQALPDAKGLFKFIVTGADGKPTEDVMIFIAQSKEGALPMAVPPTPSSTPPLTVPARILPAQSGAPHVIEVKGTEAKVVERIAIAHRATNTDNVINLTRASYALPKEQAEQLIGMFKEKAKGAVLEMKYENDKLVVTTTPEIQGVIGNVVNLMTGKPVTSAGQRTGGLFAPAQVAPFVPYSVTPVPGVPAPPATVPVAPKAPTPPKAPEKPMEPEPLQAPRLLAEGRP